MIEFLKSHSQSYLYFHIFVVMETKVEDPLSDQSFEIKETLILTSLFPFVWEECQKPIKQILLNTDFSKWLIVIFIFHIICPSRCLDLLPK